MEEISLRESTAGSSTFSASPAEASSQSLPSTVFPNGHCQKVSSCEVAIHDDNLSELFSSENQGDLLSLSDTQFNIKLDSGTNMKEAQSALRSRLQV